MTRSRRSLTPDDLSEAVAKGLYPAAAAVEFGVDRMRIRRAEASTGVRLPRYNPEMRPRTDHRAVVQDMKPLDAFDYLLKVIADLTGPVALDWCWPGVHLTPQQKKLLRALADHPPPRIMTRHSGMRALMADRLQDEEPEPKILDILVCHLRKKLAGSGLEIVTIWGRGWQMTVPPGFVWPWAEAEAAAKAERRA